MSGGNTVFFDVDTQLDFLSPAGALYVPGAEKKTRVIAALNRKAPRLISTVDAHLENDVEFRTWPPHCVLGTLGQRKPADLLVPNQIVFEKVTTDAFLNPRLMPLLGELGADRYVVYGVVTEICVRFAALGLLATGKPVDVVTDAIEALNPAAADAFFGEFTGRGGRLVSSSSIV
jgi:nicotinamidase/pyrazinamidase